MSEESSSGGIFLTKGQGNVPEPITGNGGIVKYRVTQVFAGFPVAFGFPVPSSLTESENIPFRPALDRVRGGQAVLAVGYTLNHFGSGQHALQVRSSWGSKWGDNGKGYLPIAYVRKQLCRDFWTIVSDGWIESGELRRPTILEIARQ